MKAIVMIDKDGVIGVDEQQPVMIKEDLALFKEKTAGARIIVGSKTAKAIGRKLPNRYTLLVTRNPEAFSDLALCDQVVDIDYIKELKNEDNTWVIGGGEIYRELADQIDEIHVTYYPFSMCTDESLHKTKLNFDFSAFFPTHITENITEIEGKPVKVAIWKRNTATEDISRGQGNDKAKICWEDTLNKIDNHFSSCSVSELAEASPGMGKTARAVLKEAPEYNPVSVISIFGEENTEVLEVEDSLKGTDRFIPVPDINPIWKPSELALVDNRTPIVSSLGMGEETLMRTVAFSVYTSNPTINPKAAFDVIRDQDEPLLKALGYNGGKIARLIPDLCFVPIINAPDWVFKFSKKHVTILLYIDGLNVATSPKVSRSHFVKVFKEIQTHYLALQNDI